MKIFTFFLLLIFTQHLLAQQAFEISKTGSDKVKLFKENKRVKVKTLNGEKFIGRFQIIDSQNINIKGNSIALVDIENIKSRSVIAGIAGTALIIYGAVVMVVGTLVEFYLGSTPDSMFIVGLGAIILSSGILFNQFAKNHKNTKWSYKIIDP